MIKFLQNESIRVVDDICPNTTVLEYLRSHESKSGTKEGCASGDCGACTVVVAEIDGEDIAYKSINSCIAPIGTLHGKQLITVEDLANDDSLHCVQQAMVDCHGSQCGFCTPGFIMSLFALYQSKSEFGTHECDEYLGGNLCRCTGYQPILNAAKKISNNERNDKFIQNKERTMTTLKALNDPNRFISLTHNDKQFYWPQSKQQLTDLLSENPHARLCAGSTDLALEITQQHKTLPTLIYTGAVSELTLIEVSSAYVEIGGAVTYEQAMPVLQELYPDLVKILLRLGSKQIRNVATFGGNIGNASPIGDTPPCFIALGADIVLDKQGEERTMPLEDYFIDYKKTRLQPGEYISLIRVPKLQVNQLFKTYKISKRIDDDISAVAAAFKLTFEHENGQCLVSDARISFGGMAGVPKRSSQAEKVLNGSVWDECTVSRAMAAMEEDFSPMSDVRASSAYRMQVAKNLLYKCYLESLDEDACFNIEESLNVLNLTAVESPSAQR